MCGARRVGLCSPMQPAALPANEAERLRTLRELSILDSIEEVEYDDLTLLAAKICGVPISLISLIDEDRQWFKSHRGLEVRQTPREHAFCAHAILGESVFVVEDAHQDQRFHDNPLVTGPPNVRFYAGFPLNDGQGHTLGTLCIIDHQPRQATADQLETLAALGRQVVTLLQLRRRVREVERLSEIKDQFVSMVNHELRTPLTALNGSLSLMQSGLGGPFSNEATRMLDIAHRNGDRLSALVGDLLDMSRLDSAQLELDLARHEVGTLIRGAGEVNAQLFLEYDCSLHLDLPGTPVYARVDPQRFSQVLTNLLANAARFSPPSGTVRVTLETRARATLCIIVEDEGPGVPVESREKVFERFVQLPHERKGQGTGLGLSIARSIARLHGGDLNLEPKGGPGARFVFSVPALERT